MADLPAQARLKPSKWGVITLKVDPTTPVAYSGMAANIGERQIAANSMGRTLRASNPYAYPVRFTLIALNGQVIESCTLMPGTHELKLPTFTGATCLYEIKGEGCRPIKGKLTSM
jgi:hypothetical protein